MKIDLFPELESQGFGEVHFFNDNKTQLQAIIAIHNTTRGPALGGCRFIPYPNTETALVDALGLAKGMSYKAALMDLPFGGGKSVLLKPEMPIDRTAYFTAFARFVESLNGKYIAAVDSGTTSEDMSIISKTTRHVAGYGASENLPSPYTAYGVFRGIKAAVKHKLGNESLAGLTVAIQGVGKVGYYLAQHLHEAGVKLVVSDTDQAAVEKCQTEFNAKVVKPEDIYSVDCDIFSPCALSDALSDRTIPQLRCQIVAGSANKQLAYSHNGEQLQTRGILYAPDYAINSGGLVAATTQYQNQMNSIEIYKKIDNIYDILLKIFSESERLSRSPHSVADQLAEEKLKV